MRTAPAGPARFFTPSGSLVRGLALACAIVVFAAMPAVAGGVVDTGIVDTAALMDRLADLPGGPSRPALDAALTAYADAVSQGTVARTELLTVIDYSRPSTESRLWVLDLERARVLYRELVAHGKRSGDNITQMFSNAPGSLMTSLGLFVTDAPYVGRNGYSLRLRGLEPGVNDQAYARAIVMHGASYVSQAVAERLGRLGRSLGCPAVRADIARRLIDTIKGGSVIYAYGGRPEQTASSRASR